MEAWGRAREGAATPDRRARRVVNRAMTAFHAGRAGFRVPARNAGLGPSRPPRWTRGGVRGAGGASGSPYKIIKFIMW